MFELKNNTIITGNKGLVVNTGNITIPEDTAREGNRTITTIGLITAGYKLAKNIPTKSGKLAVLAGTTILDRGINYATNMINSSKE